MAKFKKYILIFITAVISIFILLVFILINFPYDSFVNKFRAYLKNEYSVELIVDGIRYRFPLKLELSNVDLYKENNVFKFNIESILLKFSPFSFPKGKTFQAECNGINLNSSYIDLSKSELSLKLKIRLLKLLKSDYSKTLESINVDISKTKIEKVVYSGFEFKSFNIDKVDFFICDSGESFNIERGIILSDIFTANATGKMTYSNDLNLSIKLKLSNEFYRRYTDLKELIDNISDNGTITIKISGNIEKPKFKIERAK